MNVLVNLAQKKDEKTNYNCIGIADWYYVTL